MNTYKSNYSGNEIDELLSYAADIPDFQDEVRSGYATKTELGKFTSNIIILSDKLSKDEIVELINGAQPGTAFDIQTDLNLFDTNITFPNNAVVYSSTNTIKCIRFGYYKAYIGEYIDDESYSYNLIFGDGCRISNISIEGYDDGGSGNISGKFGDKCIVSKSDLAVYNWESMGSGGIFELCYISTNILDATNNAHYISCTLPSNICIDFTNIRLVNCVCDHVIAEAYCSNELLTQVKMLNPDMTIYDSEGNEVVSVFATKDYVNSRTNDTIVLSNKITKNKDELVNIINSARKGTAFDIQTNLDLMDVNVVFPEESLVYSSTGRVIISVGSEDDTTSCITFGSRSKINNITISAYGPDAASVVDKAILQYGCIANNCRFYGYAPLKVWDNCQLYNCYLGEYITEWGVKATYVECDFDIAYIPDATLQTCIYNCSGGISVEGGSYNSTPAKTLCMYNPNIKIYEHDTPGDTGIDYSSYTKQPIITLTSSISSDTVIYLINHAEQGTRFDIRSTLSLEGDIRFPNDSVVYSSNQLGEISCIRDVVSDDEYADRYIEVHFGDRSEVDGIYFNIGSEGSCNFGDECIINNCYIEGGYHPTYPGNECVFDDCYLGHVYQFDNMSNVYIGCSCDEMEINPPSCVLTMSSCSGVLYEFMYHNSDESKTLKANNPDIEFYGIPDDIVGKDVVILSNELLAEENIDIVLKSKPGTQFDIQTDLELFDFDVCFPDNATIYSSADKTPEITCSTTGYNPNYQFIIGNNSIINGINITSQCNKETDTVNIILGQNCELINCEITSREDCYLGDSNRFYNCSLHAHGLSLSDNGFYSHCTFGATGIIWNDDKAPLLINCSGGHINASDNDCAKYIKTLNPELDIMDDNASDEILPLYVTKDYVDEQIGLALEGDY